MGNIDLIHCSSTAEIDKRMTAQQTALVQQTWKLFRDINPQVIGDVFYSKLFTDEPAVKRLFKAPITAQYKKLIDMISVIVGRLQEIESITDGIREMGIRHAGYGVKPQHYKSVGDALLWTLEQGLGQDWNQEVQEAWIACYQWLADTMIEASGY
ncbi:MAG: globin domain-containing protein [Bacteroidota bacterium]